MTHNHKSQSSDFGEMLGFVSTPRVMPQVRPAHERISDFNEIYQDFQPTALRQQANRCSQCGVPFCQIHCPLGNYIPDWLQLAANGRLYEAWQTSALTNAFPEVCGRICPQDRLCEGSCVLEQSDHGTVTIGAIERSLTDMAWQEGWIEPIAVSRAVDKTVAIIGAGPAGLSAAIVLRRAGFSVEIFDRYDRAGGLMVYGIPNFKLDKTILSRRQQWLEDSGVRFHFNVTIDKQFAQLRAEYDAVLIACGVYKPRALDITTSDLANDRPAYLEALPYLTQANRQGLGLAATPGFDARGHHVTVIGGGDTAMDCVRTAVRQHALSVTCLYRRDRQTMPGSQREVYSAENEGVDFQFLTVPTHLEGAEGQLKAVQGQQVHLGRPDSSGRAKPVVIPDSHRRIESTLVIAALGFEPEPIPNHFNAHELAVTGWGTVLVNPDTYETNLDRVYAAGDIVRGASLVVWAIREGQEAAEAIIQRLGPHS